MSERFSPLTDEKKTSEDLLRMGGITRRTFLKGIGVATALTLTERYASLISGKYEKQQSITKSREQSSQYFNELLTRDINDFNYVTVALEALFKLLDNLEFERVKYLPGDKHFQVEVVEKSSEEFKKGLIKDNQTQILPVFGLRIVLAKDFTLADLPAFNQAVAEKHNQGLQQNRINNPEYQLSTNNEQLAEFWYFFANKLQQTLSHYTQEYPGAERAIVPAKIGVFQNIFQSLGAEYNSNQNIDTNQSQALEAIWELEIKKPLDRLLEKKGSKQKEDINEVALARLFQKTLNKVEQRLQTQFRENLFQHCELEMIRKSDLIQSVKDNWNNPDIEALFSDISGFEIEITDLKELQRKYQEANKLSKENSEDRRQQEIVSWLQIESAKHIGRLVYSEELWKGQENEFSFRDIINKEVNCVAREELIYRLHKYFFNEEILAVTKSEHIFSLKRLANGKYLSLDGFDTEISNLEQWKKDNHIYSIGLHSDLHQAASLSSVAETDNLILNMILLQEAIRLAPDDPEYKNNLAVTLFRLSYRWTEAEKLYREAIRLVPDNLNYKNNLAGLLARQPNRWKEAEKLYQEVIEKFQEKEVYKKYMKTWYMTSAGSFYLGEELLDRSDLVRFQTKFSDENGTAKEKAIALLEKVLNLMKEDKQYKNFLTVEQIEEKLWELKGQE